MATKVNLDSITPMATNGYTSDDAKPKTRFEPVRRKLDILDA